MPVQLKCPEDLTPKMLLFSDNLNRGIRQILRHLHQKFVENILETKAKLDKELYSLDLQKK
jgi:hypothetical protein